MAAHLGIGKQRLFDILLIQGECPLPEYIIAEHTPKSDRHRFAVLEVMRDIFEKSFKHLRRGQEVFRFIDPFPLRAGCPDLEMRNPQRGKKIDRITNTAETLAADNHGYSDLKPPADTAADCVQGDLLRPFDSPHPVMVTDAVKGKLNARSDPSFFQLIEEAVGNQQAVGINRFNA